MKKVLSLFIMLSITGVCYANFDFGATTYQTAGTTLVVNSLGDQTIVSKYGTLGTNDWIPENAVKNQFKLDGYSVAHDYNPTASHSWGVYDQALLTNQPLTELKFAGLLGDPRTEQSVYVLTSEYNRLNDTQQAIRMDNIDTVNNTQTTNIMNNTSNIATETTNRINTDNVLQSNINTETNERINGDKRNEQAINNVSNRVNDLEATHIIVGLQGRVWDSRKIQVNTFIDYATDRQAVDSIGVRVTYKFGRSYEEKRLDELQARLDKLEGKTFTQTKELNISPNNNGFKVNNKF